MLKLILGEIYLDKNIQLELYTRPTCSDCQESKRYLNSQEISYSHKDVSQNLDLEEEMKKISGNRIVPLFVFYKKNRKKQSDQNRKLRSLRLEMREKKIFPQFRI